MNKYDDIDFLLDIYNDLIYSKEPKNNYEIRKINKSTIYIDDIKKTNNYDYKKYIFNSNNKFTYVGKTSSETHQYRMKTINGLYCNVYFGVYKDVNDTSMINNAIYPMTMMYILSELVTLHKFIHTLLPVMLFDIIDNEEIFKDFKELKEFKDNKIYVMITEGFTENMTMSQYIEKNWKTMDEKEWKTLFFQILYALYTITDFLPDFRHNKLDLDAILVFDDERGHTKYSIEDNEFKLPNINKTIKIHNYELSKTTSYLNKTKETKTEYYDVHYFFNCLLRWLEQNKEIIIPPSIIKFINEVVPEKLREPINIEDKNITHHYKYNPVSILKKNNFFMNFIMVKSSKQQTNSILSSSEYTATESSNITSRSFARSKFMDRMRSEASISRDTTKTTTDFSSSSSEKDKKNTPPLSPISSTEAPNTKKTQEDDSSESTESSETSEESESESESESSDKSSSDKQSTTPAKQSRTKNHKKNSKKTHDKIMEKLDLISRNTKKSLKKIKKDSKKKSSKLSRVSSESNHQNSKKMDRPQPNPMQNLMGFGQGADAGMSGMPGSSGMPGVSSQFLASMPDSVKNQIANSSIQTAMPTMGMPPTIGMPDMSQMNMPPVSAPQMNMPLMNMPQMPPVNVPQMITPPMNMPQMYGGSKESNKKKYKMIKANNKKDFFF